MRRASWRVAGVFVDGAYAGLVDDFAGTFQQSGLEQGAHRIAIGWGFEDLEIDVYVQPGSTITLSEEGDSPVYSCLLSPVFPGEEVVHR